MPKYNKTKPRRKVPRKRVNGEPDKRLSVNAEGGKRKPLAHWFKPGHKPTSGKAGPRRVTRVLQEAMLIAAEDVGNMLTEGEGLVGYLKVQAIEHPKTFMALLARIIPLQVNLGKTDDDKPRRLTRDELRQQAIARGLPTAIFDAAIPIGNGNETVDVPADDVLDADEHAEAEDSDTRE